MSRSCEGIETQLHTEIMPTVPFRRVPVRRSNLESILATLGHACLASGAIWFFDYESKEVSMRALSPVWKGLNFKSCSAKARCSRRGWKCKLSNSDPQDPNRCYSKKGKPSTQETSKTKKCVESSSEDDSMVALPYKIAMRNMKFRYL